MCQECSSTKEHTVRMVRRKLWEIDERLCCPIIGNCLTAGEMQKLYRQCGFVGAALDSEFDVHHALVAASKERGVNAKRIHKMLDKKYANAVRQFSKAESDREVAKLWQKLFQKGEITGPLWAVATHPMVSVKEINEIYGEVHMLSHKISRTSHSVLRQVRNQEKQIEQLELNISRERQRYQQKLAEIEEENVRLQGQLTSKKVVERRIEQGVMTLSGDKIAFRKRESSQRGGERIAHLESRLGSLGRENRELRERLRQFEKRQSELSEENSLLEQQLVTVLSGSGNEADSCAKCVGPEQSLCGQCVLYVGGRSGIKGHYREVVEQRQADFIHHDGGREDSVNRLHGDVVRADRVYCAIDCVSHSAMHNVKELCRRHGKPLTMLRSSGLSTLIRGLEEVDE